MASIVRWPGCVRRERVLGCRSDEELTWSQRLSRFGKRYLCWACCCLAADVGTAGQRVLELVARGLRINLQRACRRHCVPRTRVFLRARGRGASRLPDGWPVAWMQRRQGAASARRIPGPDLMEFMLDHGRSTSLAHYFLGSSQPVLDKLQRQLVERFPDVRITGAHSPPFSAFDPRPNQELLQLIRATSPDIVWVGLGAPKQDILDARVRRAARAGSPDRGRRGVRFPCRN